MSGSGASSPGLKRCDRLWLKVESARRTAADVDFIAMNFGNSRGMVHCDANRIADLIELEEIPQPLGVRRMAVVLVSAEWGNVFYALSQRDNFAEDEYFDLAEKLIKARRGDCT